MILNQLYEMPFGMLLSEKSEENVNVLNVKGNKIVIDYSKFEHDDGTVLEIHKPLFANVKEGNIITIRYSGYYDPEYIHYALPNTVGEDFMPIVMAVFVILCCIGLEILYKSIPDNKKKKN